ncbi:hypothetical protein [Streptosporangium sp. NPDC002607]
MKRLTLSTAWLASLTPALTPVPAACSGERPPRPRTRLRRRIGPGQWVACHYPQTPVRQEPLVS